MHAWESIQEALNYIDAHLSEDIKLETLANVAFLSPFYFQHLFKRLVKKPVNEYIKLRRLAKASEDLIHTEMRIIDVALKYGFSNHANFTRAFRETYELTPDDYRGHPVILNHYIKPDLLLNYVMVDEDVPLIADGIIVEVTRRKIDEPRIFVGIDGEVPVEELSVGKSTGIATTGLIWNQFHHIKSGLTDLLPNGNEVGILYRGDAREGCCNYIAGTEVVIQNNPDGFTSFTLPCGEYVVCCFEAENFDELIGNAIFKATTFMGSWMKNHQLVSGNFTVEMYYNQKVEPSYMEIWLPLNDVQKINIKKEVWDKKSETHKPTMETIKAYVNNPLFDQLCNYVECTYQCKPIIEYSRCSMQAGWNVKYKKSGRSLCTLYPMEGYFIALVVIGEREQAEVALMLPFFSAYFNTLYHETRSGMGQKWLMIHVVDDLILEDVKHAIAIRSHKKK